MAKCYSLTKKRRREGDCPPFVRLERDLLLNQKEWKQLSARAKLLYLYIKSKYNSVNNGEIKLTYKELNGVRVISDNYNSRLTTVKIPVFLRGLIDYPGQGGPDGHRSTSEEINGDTKQGKN